MDEARRIDGRGRVGADLGGELEGRIADQRFETGHDGVAEAGAIRSDLERQRALSVGVGRLAQTIGAGAALLRGANGGTDPKLVPRARRNRGPGCSGRCRRVGPAVRRRSPPSRGSRSWPMRPARWAKRSAPWPRCDRDRCRRRGKWGRRACTRPRLRGCRGSSSRRSPRRCRQSLGRCGSRPRHSTATARSGSLRPKNRS